MHSHVSCWPDSFAKYLRVYAFTVCFLSRMFFPSYLHGSLSHLLRSLLICSLLTEAFPNFPLQTWTPAPAPGGPYPVFFPSTALLIYYVLFPLILSVSIQWMWPTEGKRLSEFYLPHALTEQCLAHSLCPKIGVEASVGGLRVVVRKGTATRFPSNQRWSLEAHRGGLFHLHGVFQRLLLVTKHLQNWWPHIKSR